MKASYNPQEIEATIQKQWQEERCFEVTEELDKEKFYCLSMLPYPSGKIHMGHVRNYTIGDVIARYQQMLGKNVLQPMGWDAFGLPAENAALENKTAPAKWTRGNIDQMRKELKQLGFAVDWRREIATCDPEYYRWEQWLFLQMYQKGLVYQKKSSVNWDPVDKTVLANEQVVDGCGWRSGAPVERKEIEQWFLKITDYADELLDSLDQLHGWPEQVRTMQRNWIGRSQGLEIKFAVNNSKEIIDVFTTRPDTIMGVTYLAIAAQHPLALAMASKNKEIAKFIDKCKNTKVSEAEIATVEKVGIETGLTAKHPLTNQEIPIWIANFVLMEYGSGAVMSVPAHDQRDFEFAQKYNLPLKQVIVAKPSQKAAKKLEAAFTDKGVLINSDQFNKLTSDSAFKAIAECLKALDKGEIKTHYRLRDWGISRQRYWGTPIPMIHCKKCGTVPVPEKDLPVKLPEDVELTDPKSPLSKITEFVNVKCPVCGAKARRETDTFDTFMESSWYYARYCSYDQHDSMLDDRANYWTPVDQYIGGIEHAVMHLLYARFLYKVMRDIGLVNSDEPFAKLLTQGMVLKDGAKMSKSKGNTVSPQKIIKKYGADTARLFVIFTAPPEQSLEWSDSGVEGAHRFLKKVWSFAYQQQEVVATAVQNKQLIIDEKKCNKAQKELRSNIHQILQQADFDIQRLQLNTVVSAAMKLCNLLQKTNNKKHENDLIIVEGLHILLRILAPITPHLAESLWQELGFAANISEAGWPKVNSDILRADSVELMVQVNGKLRGQITVAIDAKQKEIEKTALAQDNVKKFIADKKIHKIILVPNRLVNIVAA